MTKRAASYDIDPVTYEEKQRTNEKDNPIDPEGAHMRNRKIYKLVKKDNPTEFKSQSKPSLSIPGLFNAQPNKQSQKEEAPKSESSSLIKPSIFSGVSIGEGLFSSLFASIGQEKGHDQGQKKEGASTGSIFAQDNKQMPKTSLFGTSGSLFGSNAQPDSRNTASLFGGSTNIFNNSTNQSKGSIFSIPQPKEHQEEEEGDSAQLQRRQTMDMDPSKSSAKFEYNQDCKVLKSVKLAKFKKDNGQLIDNPMKISLLEDKTGQAYYIVVQLLATQKSIFSGVILPGKSQAKSLNSKAENVEIVAFTVGVKEKKLQRHAVKIQIINEEEEDSKHFLGKLKQVIEGKQESKSE